MCMACTNFDSAKIPELFSSCFICSAPSVAGVESVAGESAAGEGGGEEDACIEWFDPGDCGLRLNPLLFNTLLCA